MAEEKPKEVHLVARKIRTLRTTLDNMKAFVSRFNPEVNNLNQINIRLNEVVEIKQTFQLLQDELKLLEDKSDEERIAERLLF